MANKRASRRGLQLLIGAAAVLALGTAFLLLGLPGAMLDGPVPAAEAPPDLLDSEAARWPDRDDRSRSPASLAAPAAEESPSGLDDLYFAGVPADATFPFTIRGSVVDQSELPLAHASLLLELDECTRALVAKARADGAAVGSGDSLGSGPRFLADEQGRFVFRVPRALEGLGSDISVFVDDPRCTLTRVDCDWRCLSECDVGPIHVTQGAEIHGRVLDERDAPIAGAHVELRGAQHYQVFDAMGYPGEPPAGLGGTTTDAAGRYRIGQLWAVAELDISIIIDAPGYRSASRMIGEWEVGASLEIPDIKLDAGLSLVVIVVDEHGEPIDDAVIVACRTSSASSMPDPVERLMQPGLALPFDFRPARALGDGRYEVGGLENTGHVLAVAAPGRVGKRESGVWPATAPKRITLEPRDPAATVVDLIVRDEDGTGIEAKLSCHGPNVPITKVDTGHFRLDLLAVQQTVVDVEATGFAIERVTVTAGTSPVELALVPGCRVRGSVVDDRSEALSSAYVSVRPVHSERMAGKAVPRPLPTDAEGHFRTEGLAPGSWLFVSRAEGHLDMTGSSEVQLELQAGTEGQVSLTLPRCGELSGRLRVPPTPSMHGANQPPVQAELFFGDDEGWARREDVGPDGSFLFTGLAPGVYHVWSGDLCSLGVVVQAGGKADAGYLEARPPEPPAPLPTRVTVFVHDGDQPVASALVQWDRWAGFYQDAGRTDETGRVGFPCSGASAIRVRARLADGGFTETSRVELVPAQTIFVELVVASAQLSGIVTNSMSGAPVPGATLILEDHGSGQADDQGVFVFRHVPAGDHFLRAEADGFFSERTSLVVTQGKATEQQMPLRPAAQVSVAVTAPNGLPVAATVLIWRVQAERRNPEEGVTRLECAADGRTGTDVTPGTYLLVACELVGRPPSIDWLDEHCANARRVYLGAGKTEPVTLEVEQLPE